jgi:glycosyltransferase involved in cell wall biosynthesis
MQHQTTPKAVTISVIIPTHNRSQALQLALQSVLVQTYTDFEIIIVDDGSTDDTAQVVARYAGAPIRYIKHDRCLGASAARNTAIQAANGTYVAFLDDDDQWLEHKLERQLATIVATGFDAIVCGSHSTGRVYLSYAKALIDPNDLRRGNIIGGTSTFFIKRSILINELFDEALPSCQDWDLLIRLTRHYRVGYLNERLVLYNDGPHDRITNAPANMPLDEIEKRMRAACKHKDFLGPYRFSHAIARQLLKYPSRRSRLMNHLFYTVKRCGLLPVLGVILHRIRIRCQPHSLTAAK